jgi:hypothetical protein
MAAEAETRCYQCQVMYLMVEVAPQLWGFESQREFLTKARRACSGHPAAPTGLVEAERNMVSTTSRRPETKHRHTCFAITHGAEGVAASGGRYG